MSEKEVPECEECKSYQPRHGFCRPKCLRVGTHYFAAWRNRESGEPCGPEGKLFEPRLGGENKEKKP
jgi:hypothetical protein